MNQPMPQKKMQPTPETRTAQRLSVPQAENQLMLLDSSYQKLRNSVANAASNSDLIADAIDNFVAEVYEGYYMLGPQGKKCPACNGSGKA